jgi:hypothetical protein
MPTMPTLRDWWAGFWGTVQHSPTILPTRHAILPDHSTTAAGQNFKRDQHYFVVKVNRIFLKYGREFWTTYAPMALVVSEFDYNGQDTVVPFFVGPSLLEKDKIELPTGFVFSDTKVAGIHAYKGGGLKLTVILYRVKRTDLANRLLKVIENVASVLDFSQALSSYLKIANVLVGTVGELIGTDKDNQPIIGLRKEFDGAGEFKPGYFALIDSGNSRIDQDKLWVRDNELLFGETMDTAKEFADANFVLYSIGQTKERDDFDQLPFYSQWKTALAESFTAEPEKWKSAQANWTALYQQMSLSPDLVLPQADTLADECYAQMESNYNKIKARLGKQGPADSEQKLPGQTPDLRALSARLNTVRSKSVSVLR